MILAAPLRASCMVRLQPGRFPGVIQLLSQISMVAWTRGRRNAEKQEDALMGRCYEKRRPRSRSARQSAHPVHQRYQVRAVPVGYCREFQTHSAVGNQMLHDGFDPDLSFPNEKIKLGFFAHWPRSWGGEE